VAGRTHESGRFKAARDTPAATRGARPTPPFRYSRSAGEAGRRPRRRVIRDTRACASRTRCRVVAPPRPEGKAVRIAFLNHSRSCLESVAENRVQAAAPP
jgi:hypothetical protein